MVTKCVRRKIASTLKTLILGDDSIYSAGEFLREFAKYFGARVPSKWIPDQLFEDCITWEIMTIREWERAALDFANRHSFFVDAQWLDDVDDEIFAFFDVWKQDAYFIVNCRNFKTPKKHDELAMKWEKEAFEERWSRDGYKDSKEAAVECKEMMKRHRELQNWIKAEDVKIWL